MKSHRVFQLRNQEHVDISNTFFFSITQVSNESAFVLHNSCFRSSYSNIQLLVPEDFFKILY